MSLPTEASNRKRVPIFSGVLMYFPDALAAVAEVSKIGNDQHNPGEPLHWAREKSTDQLDCAVRHIMDYGTGVKLDPLDGGRHLAKAAWRVLAELQLSIEKEREHEQTHTNSHGGTSKVGQEHDSSGVIKVAGSTYRPEGRDQTSLTRSKVSERVGVHGKGDVPVYDPEPVLGGTRYSNL